MAQAVPGKIKEAGGAFRLLAVVHTGVRNSDVYDWLAMTT